MIEFRLPSLGADMDEARLNEWMIKPGDPVEKGQVVAEVETTKSAIDVEAWHEGTVAELIVEVGQTIPVGTVMALFLEPGETPPTDRPPQAQAPATPAAENPIAETPAVETPAPTSPAPTPPPPPTPPAPTPPAAPAPTAAPTAATPVPAPMADSGAAPITRTRISPAARRRAHVRGIDPDVVSGTGPGGAITLADVDRAADAAPTAQPSAPSVAPAQTAADRAKEMRRTIGAAMSRSKREIPHYYLSESIPLAAAQAWLSERNAQRSVTERILPAVLLLKAVAVAAGRYPEMNGFWIDEEFHQQSAVHVGVAVSLRRGGLIAPAIHDVPDKSLDRIQADLTDLVKRTRAGKLRSSEVSDPTLTVTNLGDQGVESVFGVIYPPQVALVGFGKPVVRPWVVGDDIRPVSVVVASLAADHRVSDGRRGGLFLAHIRDLLQRPDQL
ncbi:dihydrolipoamide acetyltransferase family protein [Gordonia rhizosphera]|uniref:Dihydrolipoamide acetyltransferase component of pyruvate dehydrogenase complex n=1 Tax=Gordonia rhizosphera NBRC 16068 TaxID=1108045 RepID=K6VQH9_9ACTN|nr:dihydrolipoamide acetyltransferase family protein [Gordonia rhizosphera]GAB89170.1 pyruvate dehydrogenase E2 component [Gordonia rhizosphera NBRC 16068]